MEGGGMLIKSFRELMKRHFHFTLYIMLLILFYLIIISCSQKLDLKDINISGPLGEITLKTDKTEYKRGETIQIIVFNGLNETVTLEGGSGCQGYPYVISKYEDGKWNDFPSACGGCKMMIMNNLDAHSGVLFMWNQKVFEKAGPYSSKRIRIQCLRLRVGAGTYKAKIWTIKRELFESNEFRIK